MELYDTHCHLDFDVLAADLAGVCARARAGGVQTVVVPGVDPEQWRRSEALPDGELRVLRAVGLHPRAIGEADIGEVEEHARRWGAVAIGEVGWDRGAAGSLERQDRAVDEHLELARSLGLPVILHVVGRHGHALERLGRHGPLEHGGAVHGFSGAAELVPRYASLGLALGFGPALTRTGARKVLGAARAVEERLLLLETDAPDQSVAVRGPGEPAELRTVAEVLAELRGVTVEHIAAVTTRNARALFERK